MTRRLTPAQIRSYREEGWASPVDVLSPSEVTRIRAGLEAWEQHAGKPLAYPEKSAAYLLFDWADALAFHPAILDAVEDLIGPDILAYHSTIFIKEAHTPAFVHWHQDGAYFFLDPAEQVTAIYARALGRPPRAAEAKAAVAFLTSQAALLRKEKAADPDRLALIDLGLAVFNVSEFVYVK